MNGEFSGNKGGRLFFKHVLPAWHGGVDYRNSKVSESSCNVERELGME